MFWYWFHYHFCSTSSHIHLNYNFCQIFLYLALLSHTFTWYLNYRSLRIDTMRISDFSRLCLRKSTWISWFWVFFDDCWLSSFLLNDSSFNRRGGTSQIFICWRYDRCKIWALFHPCSLRIGFFISSVFCSPRYLQSHTYHIRCTLQLFDWWDV